MFNNPYYFSLIRKYVTLIGTLFDDIDIVRTDSQSKETSVLKVPITYAIKDKMLTRVLEDPGIDKKTAVTLPIISFEMKNLNYDNDRKLNTVNKRAFKEDANNFKFQYQPVPYDFSFSVYIYFKNQEDGLKILEQILPYFTPDWTTKVKLIPEMQEERDIPVFLNNVSMEEKYDGKFEERQYAIFTLNLTLKGYLYGPINKGPVIKIINTEFYAQTTNANNELSFTISVTPGMTNIGTATSNSQLTVPYNTIEVTDDYGYITTKIINNDSE